MSGGTGTVLNWRQQTGSLDEPLLLLIRSRECFLAFNATNPAGAAEANAFALHIFGAFRFEAMCGVYLYTLLATALAYASSVPVPDSALGVLLYWVWNVCYLVQVVCAVAVVVILGMSAARLHELITAAGCSALVSGWHVGLAGASCVVLLIGIWGHEGGSSGRDHMLTTTGGHRTPMSYCCSFIWQPKPLGCGVVLGGIMWGATTGQPLLPVYAWLASAFQPEP